MNSTPSALAAALIAGLLAGTSAHAQTPAPVPTDGQTKSESTTTTVKRHTHKAATAGKENSCKGDKSGCPGMDMSGKSETPATPDAK